MNYSRAMLQLVVLLAALSASVCVGEPQKTPKGLAGSDWSAIRAEYDRHRQAVFPVDGGHRARNYSQQWVTRFDGRGFEVTPDAANWRWGLELTSYGFPGHERRVQHARASAGVEKFSYQWDATMKEWFVNGRSGLEQGFTLASRPGDSSSPLMLHLAVRGTLNPQVSSDGRWVSFQDGRGAGVLNYAGLKVSDADGRELAARFLPESRGLRLEVEERGARYPITIDPLAQQAYLKPAAVGTTQAGDEFGISVAVNGDTVVVGAIAEDSSSLGVNSTPNELATDAGAAYVFVRTAGVWSQQAYLKPAAVGTSQVGDNFGQSVAISGDTIVVGAYREGSSSLGINSTPNEGAADAGAVYVFTRSGVVWTQQAYIKPAAVGTSQQGDRFGFSVAIDVDTMVAGAIFEKSSTTGINTTPDELTSQAGAAYVFTRTAGIWSQQAYIKPTTIGTTQSGDNFGNSVSISGDTLVVGSRFEDSSSTGVNSVANEAAADSGAAFVFTRTSGVWSQQVYLKPAAVGTSQVADNFGYSVGVSGDTVVVGARQEGSSSVGINSTPDDLSPSTGAAYIFTRSAGVWSQQAYLKPAFVGSSEQFDLFGTSVAISGNVVAVGATGEASNTLGINTVPNESSNSSGAVYVFTRTAGAWSQEAYLKPSAVGTTQFNDNFGISVAVNRDTVVGGAYAEDSSSLGVNSTPDEGSGGSGAAYVFTVVVPPVNVTINSSPSGLLFSSSGTGCAPGAGYVTPQVLSWTLGSACSLSFGTPQSGATGVRFVFNHWEDSSTNATRSITAPEIPPTYTATFDTQYQLTTGVSGSGTVTPPTGFFASGTIVPLTATPSGGSAFQNWTGAVANANAASTTVTMSGPQTVTANFVGSVIFPSHVGIFRSGFFWLEDVDGNQQFNSPPDRAFAFGGVAGDIAISGDWNGSGTTKVGVYRPSNGLFVLDYDGDGQFTAADKAYNLGVGIDATDKPVVGDWNGDGKSKVGLFRQGFFWILDTNGNGAFEGGVDQALAFGGVAGDVPVVGDWTGSGTSKIGLFRQGFFWILDANGNGSLDNVNGVGGDQAFAYGGVAGDVPMVGDWNADGKSKVGVFRAGFFWVLDANGNHTFDGTGVGQDLAFPFGGLANDKPVVGKW